MSLLHRKNPLSIIVLLGSAILMSSYSHAGSVLIWPLDPVLEHDQKAAALWIENKDIAPAQMQIRVLKWEQKNGKDEYTKQNDVIISPPYASIEPGKRQLIRLIKNTSIPADTEVSYRILIDEMPSQKSADTPKTTNGLTFQMRYSVPLFVSGENVWTKQDYEHPRDIEKSTLPKLSYRLLNQQGKKYLEVKNTGTVHAKIINITAKQGSEKKEWLKGLVGYVLPDATMNIPVPDTVNTAQFDSIEVMVNSYPHPIKLDRH